MSSAALSFEARRLHHTTHPRTCKQCGIDFPAFRRNQMTCSIRCRTGYLRSIAPTPKNGVHAFVVNGTQKREYVVTAEKALGRSLPKGVVVHHVDEDRSNGENSNLVICENQTYHLLIHARTRIVRAGGDPDSEAICGMCGAVKPHSAFSKDSSEWNGFRSNCSICRNAYRRARLRKVQS